MHSGDTLHTLEGCAQAGVYQDLQVIASLGSCNLSYQLAS